MLAIHKEKSSKRERSPSSSSSSSSCSSSSSQSSTHHASEKHSSAKKAKRKLKKKMKKKLRKEKKKLKKELKKQKKKLKKAEKSSKKLKSDDQDEPAPMETVASEVVAERAKAMAPMTKEEWEKQQSVVRRVYDETTGRHRLIKGDGEIIEEIVSRERHQEINKQATRGDGAFFQSKISSSSRK